MSAPRALHADGAGDGVTKLKIRSAGVSADNLLNLQGLGRKERNLLTDAAATEESLQEGGAATRLEVAEVADCAFCCAKPDCALNDHGCPFFFGLDREEIVESRHDLIVLVRIRCLDQLREIVSQVNEPDERGFVGQVRPRGGSHPRRIQRWVFAKRKVEIFLSSVSFCLPVHDIS